MGPGLSDFERVSLLLLSTLVAYQIAESGDQKRKARAIGLEGVKQAQELFEADGEVRIE